MVDDCQAYDAKLVLDIVWARSARISGPATAIAGAVHVMGASPEIQVRALEPQCPGIGQQGVDRRADSTPIGALTR